MKKIIGIASKWLMKSGGNTIIEGVEVVGKNKINKLKITAVIIAVLGLLLLTGSISEETFIVLYKESSPF